MILTAALNDWTAPAGAVARSWICHMERAGRRHAIFGAASCRRSAPSSAEDAIGTVLRTWQLTILLFGRPGRREATVPAARRSASLTHAA